MITKIHEIRGVGRFKAFKPDSPIELAKLSIAYGENGKGKSSLAAILRSLQDGGERHLGNRKTLGENKQCVVIELNDGSTLGYASPGRGWKSHDLDVLVFDEIFIGENVFEGITVTKVQKRNLPKLILGKDEIDLVEQEQRVKKSIGQLTTKLQDLRNSITQQIEQPDESFGVPLDVEKFIALQPSTKNIEELVSDQVRKLDRLKNADRILNGKIFDEVLLPTLPVDELAELLTFTIADIEASALERVHNHLACFDTINLSGWIEQGIVFTSDDDICPYCGRPLEGSDLVKQYQDYFRQDYREHSNDVRKFAEHRLQFSSIMDAINRTITANQGVIAFWSPEIDGLHAPALDFDSIRIALTNIQQEVKSLLQDKSGQLLEAIPLSEQLKSYIDEWISIGHRVDEYNAQHTTNNLAISRHKETLDSGDLNEAQRGLVRLSNMKLRFSPAMSKICCEYLEVKETLDRENSEKASLQAQIKSINGRIDDTFVNDLNRYLTRLNADYEISKVKVRPDGTEWQVDYCIALLEKHIPVGGNSKLTTGQSYKSVLSEGDRRTLALALFLVSIDDMVGLEKAVVVFDDPVTSMDDNRSSATAELILEVCEKAGQVIVLSHRKRFLRNFLRKYKRGQNRYGNVRLVEVCPAENNSRYSELRAEWDLKKATESEFEENVRYVEEYIRNSPRTDKVNAAPKLRYVLETHYTSLYQEELTEGSQPFGVFIDKVMNCSKSSPLYPLQMKDGMELYRLNQATSTFHHPDPLDLEETELRQLCKDVLDLIGRRY